MTHARYRVDERGLKSLIKDFKVLSGPIHYKMVQRLEKVLQEFYVDTQDKTHIWTGSLKASGFPESDYDANEWSGSVTYGGEVWRPPTPGPVKIPGEYIEYEIARGEEHDMFRDAPKFVEKFEHAIHTWMPEAK